ncbi:MAG: hypothetical protein HQK51_04335 [Oligoflexia bacterium]|nr:hypothetical protein [Oligoflexia bacterium]
MKRVEKNNPGDYYLRSGIQEYYLPGLPDWANFSSAGQCRRKHSTYYFDLKKISQSFNFDYKQSVQFQLSFNKYLADYHTKFSMKKLNIKDEEIVFYTTKDHITYGNLPFKIPSYKRVNLIWIDETINNSTKLKSLTKLMNSDEIGSGHPVFISLCLFNDEVDSFISGKEFKDTDIRIISHELFSIYNEKFEMLNHFYLNFDLLFNKQEQQLFLYLPSSSKKPPLEFKGTFKIHYY